MWRLTPDTLIGRNFWDVFLQMTGTDAEKYLRIAVEAGTRVEYETFSLIFARWLWGRVCPMSGALTGVYWRDISDRKSAEAALGGGDECFRRVVVASPLRVLTAVLYG